MKCSARESQDQVESTMKKAQYRQMKTCFLAVLFFSLTQSALAMPCQSLLSQNGASLEVCGGIRVLHLSGAPVERAKRFGELVKEGKISREVLHYFVDKISDVAKDETGWFSPVVELADNQLARLFHRQAPAEIGEEIDAMAQAMGIDPIELRRGLSLPDTGVFLQGLGSFPGLHFLPATGCTSIAAKLDGGGFAYGRNLDFAGIGIWDRHPMILSVEPQKGFPELKHLVIGAEGLPFAGITGVNEAGLTFAVHQNYSRDISVTGVPMVLIGELVLRQARTLDQAVELLKKYRPANLWTFVLTDLHENAIAVESSSRSFLVRNLKGEYFAQTNHALHPETREVENSSYGLITNSNFRLDHILTTLIAHPPKSQSGIAMLLAYQEDPLGQLSAYHDIQKSDTIQTAIFESHSAKDATLALSVDSAPTASGHFAVFPLQAFWDQIPITWEPRDFTNTDPTKRLRQRDSSIANHLYFDERKLPEAASILAGQKSLDAALFRCTAMAELGRFEDSLRISDEALIDPHFTSEPVYIRDSVTLVKLVSLFRLHRMEEARNLAQSVVERGMPGKPGPSMQPALLEVARKIVSNETIPSWRLSLHFDFFSGDLSGRKD
jgi:hypothetical protein